MPWDFLVIQAGITHMSWAYVRQPEVLCETNKPPGHLDNTLMRAYILLAFTLFT